MILPLGDAPNPRGTPFVNYALIAANVAVFVLVTLPLSTTPADPSDPAFQAYVALILERVGGAVPVRDVIASISAYDLVVFRHGFRPAEPSLQGLFTSMFLHGGFLHLAGNMLFLWIYGDNVEHRLGRVGYVAAYVGTGIAATLAHTVFDPGSKLPMVGASGAISGALGFYFLFFPRNTVRLFVVLFPFLVDVITVPARIVLGFYLLLDNLLPFLITRGTGAGGVAHGAHIGGFVAGLGAAWWIDRRERVRRPREYRPAAREAKPGEPVALGIARLVNARRFAEAAELYFAADERTERELPPTVALLLGRWLAESGHPTAALSVFRRVLRRQGSGPIAAEAHVGAGLVQLQALDRPAAAWQHFLEALELAPTSEAATTARSALRAIEATQRRQARGPRA